MTVDDASRQPGSGAGAVAAAGVGARPVAAAVVDAGPVAGGARTAMPDRERRRTALLDAADVVVRRDGPAASMSAIAAEAGITKPILYRVFGDKGGLYQALAERHTASLLDAVGSALRAPGDLHARSRRSIEAYLAVIESGPEIYRFLTSGDVAAEPGVQSHVRTTVDALAEQLAIGIAIELRRPLPAGMQEQVWARGIVGMVQAAGDWWLRSPGAISRGEVADGLTDLLFGRFPELSSGAGRVRSRLGGRRAG